MRYADLSLIDETADWPPDGHRGKQVTVGGQHAMVTFNTETELSLAPVRPGSKTAWSGGTPKPGASYDLPDPPDLRAGIAIAAAVSRPQMDGNRIWDNQQPRRTQQPSAVLNRAAPPPRSPGAAAPPGA